MLVLARLRRLPRGVRLGLVLGAGLGLVGVMLARPALREPASFRFADERALLGLPHAWNVLSNLPFALVGGLGLVRLGALAGALRPAAGTFFAATAAVAVGSSAYHLAPGPSLLFVDRLPITLAFMGLFAWVLGDRLPAGLVRLVLPAASALALWALWVWRGSGAGDGDLRFYLLVQGVPLVTIPLLFALFPARAPGTLDGRRVGVALALYLVGVALQAHDAEVYARLGFVAGHPLRHLVTAAACASLVPPRSASPSSATARR